MAEGPSELKSAIQGLKIGHPFDLRKQGQVALQPPPVELPQKEEPRPKVPEIETAQAQAPQIEKPQPEVPRQNGFFRLAHSVFGDPILQKLSGDSFRLFLWMTCQAWRYQDSDGTLRASISYMENGTGISHATISRSLAQLKDLKLIELIQTDFKRGNQWRVSDCARGKGGPAQSGAPQFEPPPPDTTSPSKRGSSHHDSSKQAAQNEGEVRSSKSPQENTKNSLSAKIELASLRTYLDELKPARKRESELKGYWELRNDYSEAQIWNAVSFLESRGLPESGNPCHSPMAYLGLAMRNVLPYAEAERNLAIRSETLRREQEEQSSRREALEKLALEDTERASTAFLHAFPEIGQQQEVIDQYAAKFPFLDPSGPVIRNLAIGRWWHEQEEQAKT